MPNLLEPFSYDYMINALWVSTLVGAVCGFLSAYIILKGWSLIGDALSHSVVPGVAGAYMLGLPYSVGAFISGGLAAVAMLFISAHSRLKPDVVIGLIFSGFFALGLFMISIRPASVRIETIVFGNLLAISPQDSLQLVIIAVVSLIVLAIKWKDLMLVFFDESHALSVGLNATALKIMFFTILSACTVAALMAVGAFLVVAMVVTPGAIAYLLTDRFSTLLSISIASGALCSAIGCYLSYFINGVTGGVIILLLTGVLLCAFFFAPTHGMFASRRRMKQMA